MPSSQIFKKFEIWPTKFLLTAARSNSNVFGYIMLQHPQKNMPLLPLTLSSALQPPQRAEPSVLQPPALCATSPSTSSSEKGERNCQCSQLCQGTLSMRTVPDCPELPKERSIFIVRGFSAFLPLVKQGLIRGWHVKDKAAR